jgi:hypothetical protein
MGCWAHHSSAGDEHRRRVHVWTAGRPASASITVLVEAMENGVRGVGWGFTESMVDRSHIARVSGRG